MNDREILLGDARELLAWLERKAAALADDAHTHRCPPLTKQGQWALERIWQLRQVLERIEETWDRDRRQAAEVELQLERRGLVIDY